MYKEHPIKILKYSAKSIWLLLIPLLKRIYMILQIIYTMDFEVLRAEFDMGRFLNWIRATWLDLIVFLAIILFGAVRWYCSGITLTDEAVVHTDGVFIKTKTSIPYDRISSVTQEHSFYLRPIHAVRVRFDTSAGIFNVPDMKLIIGKKVCGAIEQKLPKVSEKSKSGYRHRNGLFEILLFSVFFSSSFSGAVYISAFFFKGGDIAKKLISASFDKITEETSKLPIAFIRHIPTAIIGIGIIFLATWLLSFSVNMLRYYGFRVRTDSKNIITTCGLFSRRKYFINTDEINYIDFRQNLVMKLFDFVSVSINCAGYGTEKNEYSLIFPLKQRSEMSNIPDRLWKLRGKKHSFRPDKFTLWTYIWMPFLTALAVYPLMRILPVYIPKLDDMSFFVALMLEIPLIWLTLIGFASSRLTRIRVCRNKIVLKYSRFFGFHTIIADKERIAKITITQNPFQRFKNRCNAVFIFNGEMSKKHRIKAFRCEDIKKIADILGYDCDYLINKE